MFNKVILIPIGGIGSRFKKNGYNNPKSLINIFGKPIIYYLLKNLIIDTETLVYIAYNNEYVKYRFEDQITSMFPGINFKFYHLNTNTDGAAETINIALKNIHINYDLPILCLDSDSFYTCDILKLWNKKNAVFYFDDDCSNPIYSYLNIDIYSNKIIEIKEKEKISNKACCGAYGFSSYYQLLHYTSKIIKENKKFKNEFYTSVCIGEMINNGVIFKPVNLPKSDFHVLGTPIQLKQFYNNSPQISCLTNLKNNSELRICFDLDNTLVSFPKIPGDYTSVEPIQENINFLKYLKNFGHTIIIYTARQMKTFQGNQGKLLANIGKVTFDSLEKLDIPFDEIYFGKPYADYYIDDKAISCYNDLEKELGFYQDVIKPRDFNTLVENTIEIFTKKSDDLSGEIYYYQNIPKCIKDMFPIFIDNDNNSKWYSIEKIKGLTLSNMYLSELLSPKLLEHVMKSIKRIQSVKISDSKKLDIYANYIDKLVNRYENYDYSKFIESEHIFNCLKEFLDIYQKENMGKRVCIHGDPVFSNILINQYDKIKFIDMRGKLGSELTIEGDWLYDWAKLYQSLIGYDEILLNKEMNLEYKQNMIHNFENIFTSWYGENDLKNLKMITNSLLFTLIPLHDNTKCVKYFKLINLNVN